MGSKVHDPSTPLQTQRRLVTTDRKTSCKRRLQFKNNAEGAQLRSLHTRIIVLRLWHLLVGSLCWGFGFWGWALSVEPSTPQAIFPLSIQSYFQFPQVIPSSLHLHAGFPSRIPPLRRHGRTVPSSTLTKSQPRPIRRGTNLHHLSGRVRHH